MSIEREEIRWELDKIFEFVNYIIDLHENEKKSFWSNYEITHSSGIKIRNSIIAVIGFVIGVIISLISIRELESSYVDFIVYGFVIAFIIFFGTNILLYFVGRKYLELDNAYRKDVSELLELKGWLIGATIKDKPNKEQVMFLAKFTFVISQVIGYNIQLKTQNLFKVEPLELNEYQETIKTVKENLEHYKKLDLKIVKTIEDFIKEFEKKSKK